MAKFDSKKPATSINMSAEDSAKMEALLRDKLTSQQAYEHAFFVYRDELSRLSKLENELWAVFKSTYELDPNKEYTCLFDQTLNKCVILHKSSSDHIFDSLAGAKPR